MTVEQYIAEFMPKMGGWCTPEKARKIAELCSNTSVRLFCELGIFCGRSFFSGALALNEGTLAVGVDPWITSESVYGFSDENRIWWEKLDHNQIYQECVDSHRKLGLESKAFLLRCTSQQALPLIKKLGPIDLLHVDGNHCQERSCFDVTSYGSLVPSGGIIIMDDCDWITTKRAQEILLSMAEPIGPVDKWGVFRKK